jgi:two-component system chemotaxis response regulator CheY
MEVTVRAIVIDDSRAIRFMLRVILRDIGFGELLEAGDGQEALKRLAEVERPDLALVDWNMPNMNGFEFIQTVRKDASFQDMKIVMVTTEIEMEQVAAALGAGANEYVMKPFTPESVREKLQLLGFDREAA